MTSTDGMYRSAAAYGSDDPLFLRHDAIVFGWVRRAPAINDATWDVFNPLLEREDAYPFGNRLSGVYVEWNDA